MKRNRILMSEEMIALNKTKDTIRSAYKKKEEAPATKRKFITKVVKFYHSLGLT